MNKIKRKLVVFAIACMAVISSCCVVFAEQTGGTANTAVVSAMTTLSNDMVATANSIIPIALTVIGLSMVVIFGVRMFKKVSGQRG